MGDLDNVDIAKCGRDVLKVRQAIKSDPSCLIRMTPSEFTGAMFCLTPAARGNHLAKLLRGYWYPDLQPLSNQDERGDYLDTLTGNGYEFKVSMVDTDGGLAHFNQIRPHGKSEFLFCTVFDAARTDSFYSFLLDKKEVDRENGIFGTSTHGKNGKERSFHLRWSHTSENLNRWLALYGHGKASVAEILEANKAWRFEA